MKNLKIYIGVIAVSFLFIASQAVCLNPVTSMLSGIGCSGMAAAIMAIFLEKAEMVREQERQQRACSLYFREMNGQLLDVIGNLIWLEDRLDEEDFNWDLPAEEYSTHRYVVFAAKMEKDRFLPFDDAMETLKAIGIKYNLDHMRTMPAEKKKKIEKMFKVTACNAADLVNEVQRLEKDKLLLQSEGYSSIEQSNQIISNITIAIQIMDSTDKNYNTAITFLSSTAKKVREIGNYEEDIHVGMQGMIRLYTRGG